MIPDDLKNCIGVGSLFERLAEIGFMEELGDVGQGMEMFLDPRILSKSYGRSFLAAIPKCKTEVVARGR